MEESEWEGKLKRSCRRIRWAIYTLFGARFLKPAICCSLALEADFLACGSLSDTFGEEEGGATFMIPMFLMDC